MKMNIFHILALGILLLTACGGTSPIDIHVSSTAATEMTITPDVTSLPLPSRTPRERPNEPTVTPLPPTPLPTIPTFTPTFDVRTIVTVTPAAKAECPIIQKDKSLDIIRYDQNYTATLIDSLNQGISIETVISALDKGHSEYYGVPDSKRSQYQMQDLTNDGVPEIMLGFVSFYIISCSNSKYEILFQLPPDGYLHPPQIVSLRDVNRNGIPDITLLLGFASQGGHTYSVYEWNGANFANIIFSDDPDYPENGRIWAEVSGDIHYEDINHDFVQELILDGGIPVWSNYVDGLPWRNKRTVYQWNGRSYTPTHYEFAAPEFRFQAIQDGDLAANQLEFDKALSLYQDAIFSDKLKSYSPDIRKNLRDNWMARVGDQRPTPTPYPDDLTEYPRLAAYAYYRIVLIHLAHRYESDASTVFNTLQQKFGSDPYGRPYAEMATVFWDTYQSTHKMYDGCAAAIEYASEHLEILIPLGSDYHGWQSHTYIPADVCPFR